MICGGLHGGNLCVSVCSYVMRAIRGDVGILHALLGLDGLAGLVSHPARDLRSV